MSLDGLYSGNQFAYASIENDYDRTTRIHEAAHRLLTQSSPWGQMIVLIRETIELEHNSDRAIEYFFPICKILFQASEFTQESFAILLSIHEARLRNNFSAIQEIYNSNYAKAYNKQYLDIYLSLEPAQHAFSLCSKLAEFAMDTHLLGAEKKHWESSESLYKLIHSNRSLYFPDFRFECLTNALSQYLNKANSTGHTKYSVSFREIIKMSGLSNLSLLEDKRKCIFSEFQELIKSVFQNDQSILQVLSLVEKRIVVTDVESDAALINYYEIPKTEWRYEPFQFSKEIFPIVNKLDVLRLFPYNDNISMVYISNSLKQYTMFRVYWNNVRSYIEIFENEIIMPCVDYHVANDNAIFSSSRRVFYFVECHHDAFKKCILELGGDQVPYIHFRKITKSTFAIFVKIRDNKILFGFQKTYALNMFVNDVFHGEYKYVQYDSTMRDNIFYFNDDDDDCYGQVVQAMLQDNNKGQRINLEDYTFH